MLDVHPPEHAIHQWRDFFLHIATIVVGLLIAVALEQSVEAVHHRHLRREAQANITAELRHNRDLITTAAPTVEKEHEELLKLLTFLEATSAGKPKPDVSSIKVGFHEQNIPDAAWRTASSTGVLTYMEYDQVQRYADAYKQQSMLQDAEEKALDDYLQFTPILQIHGKDLTPEMAKEALPFVRRAIAHVNGMLAVGAGTLESYKDALQ